jgi:hypothetical protein
MDLNYKFPDPSPKKLIAWRPESNALATMLATCQPHIYIRLTPPSSFESNQHASPLLRLPAELRVKIWEYSLGGNQILPSVWINEYMRDFHHPSNIYLRAESTENTFHFLSLLRVCRQIYAEARLLPFSCNIWLFWGYLDYSWRAKEAWADLFHRMDEEQRHAIAWVAFESRRRKIDEPAEQKHYFSQMRILTGLKVVVRRRPLHEVDEEGISTFAKEFGYKLVDEEMAPLTGVYTYLPGEALNDRGFKF